MNRPSPETNADSWRAIHEMCAEETAADRSLSSASQMAQLILTELEKLGLATVFRLGNSMNYLVFSTLGFNGLRDEPRVTLAFHPERQTVRIAYSRADLWHHAPLIDAWVSTPSAVTVILGALRRLWTETKPGQPLPEGLQ